MSIKYNVIIQKEENWYVAKCIDNNVASQGQTVEEAMRNLKEALELLRLSPDATKNEAAEFMLQLQEQVAGEVIEHVYDIINTYQGKGNRWYDSDPMMLKAVELLRNAPPKVQRVAALKLLIALEQKSFEGVEI